MKLLNDDNKMFISRFQVLSPSRNSMLTLLHYEVLKVTGISSVTTKRQNEQVKRNIKHYAGNFMFQLTEKDKVVANCDHLQNSKYFPYLPYFFTEHGTVMLANVLNSDRAIHVSIRIVEIYLRMREFVLTNKELLLKVEQLETRIGKQDERIALVLNYLKKFIESREIPRKQVGFKREDER